MIVATGWQLAASGELLVHIGSSMFRQSLGFAIGATCGVMVGLLAGVLKPVERFYDPLISLDLPGPEGRDPAADLRLVRPWQPLEDRGDDHLDLLSDLYRGLLRRQVGQPDSSLVGAQCRRQPRPVFFRIIVPSALPDIFNGLRIGLALSFVLMVTTELVVSSAGLGFMIARAEETLRFDRMYVAIVTIGAIGFCADRLLLWCATGCWLGSCSARIAAMADAVLTRRAAAKAPGRARPERLRLRLSGLRARDAGLGG